MASRGVNKVILLGNLGADPECRTFQNGDLVANFSLATSETWQDQNTGEPREKTEWHRCTAYRGLAGVVQKYVKKGSKLYIEGHLQTRKWTDKQGIERYTTEIIVDNLQMLDSRSGGAAPMHDEYQYSQPQQINHAPNAAYMDNPSSAPAMGNASNTGHGNMGHAYPAQNQASDPYASAAASSPVAPSNSSRTLPQSPVAPDNPDANMSSFADDDIPF